MGWMYHSLFTSSHVHGYLASPKNVHYLKQCLSEPPHEALFTPAVPFYKVELELRVDGQVRLKCQEVFPNQHWGFASLHSLPPCTRGTALLTVTRQDIIT